MEQIIGPIIGLVATIMFFGTIIGLFVVPRYLKSREREAVQMTIRAAIEKGQPLPPEMIDAMSRDARPAPSAARDLRTGIIWIGLACGLIGFAYAIGFSDSDFASSSWHLIGIAAFPGFIGLAFVVMSLFNRGKGKV